MRKKDEMERSIQLRAQELAYKVTVLLLCTWTLFNIWQTLAHGAEYRPLPGLIVCLAVCTQSFCHMAIKRKMVAGDEEYREPNRLLQVVSMAVVLTVIVLAFGTYFVVKARMI